MFAEAYLRVAELMQSEEFLMFILQLFFVVLLEHVAICFLVFINTALHACVCQPQSKKTISASVTFSEQRSLKSTVWFTNTFLSICFLFNLLPAMFLPQPHLLRLCKAGWIQICQIKSLSFYCRSYSGCSAQSSISSQFQTFSCPSVCFLFNLQH